MLKIISAYSVFFATCLVYSNSEVEPLGNGMILPANESCLQEKHVDYSFCEKSKNTEKELLFTASAIKIKANLKKHKNILIIGSLCIATGTVLGWLLRNLSIKSTSPKANVPDLATISVQTEPSLQAEPKEVPPQNNASPIPPPPPQGPPPPPAKKPLQTSSCVIRVGNINLKKVVQDTTAKPIDQMAMLFYELKQRIKSNNNPNHVVELDPEKERARNRRSKLCQLEIVKDAESAKKAIMDLSDLLKQDEDFKKLCEELDKTVEYFDKIGKRTKELKKIALTFEKIEKTIKNVILIDWNKIDSIKEQLSLWIKGPKLSEGEIKQPIITFNNVREIIKRTIGDENILKDKDLDIKNALKRFMHEINKLHLKELSDVEILQSSISWFEDIYNRPNIIEIKNTKTKEQSTQILENDWSIPSKKRKIIEIDKSPTLQKEAVIKQNYSSKRT